MPMENAAVPAMSCGWRQNASISVMRAVTCSTTPVGGAEVGAGVPEASLAPLRGILRMIPNSTGERNGSRQKALGALAGTGLPKRYEASRQELRQQGRCREGRVTWKPGLTASEQLGTRESGGYATSGGRSNPLSHKLPSMLSSLIFPLFCGGAWTWCRASWHRARDYDEARFP